MIIGVGVVFGIDGLWLINEVKTIDK